MISTLYPNDNYHSQIHPHIFSFNVDVRESLIPMFYSCQFVSEYSSLVGEGSFEVKLPTIWTDEKQRWEEAEKKVIRTSQRRESWRREKIKEEQVRESQKKEDQVREKVGKS